MTYEDMVVNEEDAAALAAWHAAEEDDLVVSVADRAWVNSLPAEYRALADPWLEIIGSTADVARRARLRAKMRGDLINTIDALRGSGPGVVAAWRLWYPRWVDDVVSRMPSPTPVKGEDDAPVAPSSVNERVVAAIVDVAAASPNGVLRWDASVASRVGATSKGEARRAVDYLVQHGRAKWKRRKSGSPWAVVVYAG